MSHPMKFIVFIHNRFSDLILLLRWRVRVGVRKQFSNKNLENKGRKKTGHKNQKLITSIIKYFYVRKQNGGLGQNW